MNPECHRPIRVKLPKGSYNRRKRQRFLSAIINEAIDWDELCHVAKDAILYGRGIYRMNWRAGDDVLR